MNELQTKGTITDWRACVDDVTGDVHFHVCGMLTKNGVQQYIITSRVNKIEDNKLYTANSIYDLGFPARKNI